jgi:hypothetical protein
MKAVRWTPARIRYSKVRAFSGCGAAEIGHDAELAGGQLPADAAP